MTAGIQTLSVFKAPILHHYTILLPNGHHGVWHTMDAENIFVEWSKMSDLWLDYPDKEQFGTHRFFEISCSERPCMLSHSKIFCYEPWKYLSFLEIWKERMGCRPKVTVLLLYWYTCHGASIHIFPWEIKLKCQILRTVRWLQNKYWVKNHRLGRSLYVMPSQLVRGKPDALHYLQGTYYIWVFFILLLYEPFITWLSYGPWFVVTSVSLDVYKFFSTFHKAALSQSYWNPRKVSQWR